MENQQQAINRKFLRVNEVGQLYGIRPGKLYDLLKHRVVRSICLAEPGQRKGTRLVSVESLESYLTRLESQQSAAA